MFSMDIFRKNLRYLRKKNGFSQDYIAEFFGYKNYTTVQKWESGDSEPPFGIVLRLCELYNVNVNDIVSVDLSKDEL